MRKEQRTCVPVTLVSQVSVTIHRRGPPERELGRSWLGIRWASPALRRHWITLTRGFHCPQDFSSCDPASVQAESNASTLLLNKAVVSKGKWSEPSLLAEAQRRTCSHGNTTMALSSARASGQPTAPDRTPLLSLA